MQVQTEIYLDAIEHLPEKGTLSLRDVSWEDYENLLEKMVRHPGYRLVYNGGNLKIMSPRPDHEKAKEFIIRLVSLYAEVLDIPLEAFGSTTYRRFSKAQGVEPDTSFYVQNVELVIGKENFDFEKDPAPDVVVEIDTTNESLDKFEIYANLCVLEIWRYDGETMSFLKLEQGHYEETQSSLAFPELSPDILTEYLSKSRQLGQSAALREFREFLKASE